MAYELQISDWNSDVCSSDLRMARDRHGAFDRGMIGSAHRGGLQVFAMMPTRFIGGGPPFRGSVNRQTDPAQMQAGQDDRNSGAHRKGKGDLAPVGRWP